MATPVTARTPSLHPEDWIAAAQARLSDQGVEAVRIEVLARDLGVSKGSFYWHFRDRGDLLEKLLARWEDQELAWLSAEDGRGAATRWARFVERTADPNRMRLEVALRAWARAEARVADRLAAIEARKARVIADILHNVGFTPPAAKSWSEVILLICLGWLDRATRDRQFEVAGRTLGELLSEVILAASARAASPHP